MIRGRVAVKVFFLLVALFIAYRMVAPIHFFNVSKSFARPQKITIPEGLSSVSAQECGACHQTIYEEWKSTIHSKAWVDPYFRADFVYDGSAQICLNCHIPLENQQENLVVGFNDTDYLQPILKPNPNFDKELQNEGVTCAVCHVEGNTIIGPRKIDDAPHQVKKDARFSDGSGVCKRCHLVQGARWDNFMKLPPCGNFAEIAETGKKADCVKCHMPHVTRANVEGDAKRKSGRHLFRGGHDQAMVKSGLKFNLVDLSKAGGKHKKYRLDITNVGADHRIPTGTPDRHLEVNFVLMDEKGKVIDHQKDLLERVILWRPFIIDLWDTRIKSGETYSADYSFDMPDDGGRELKVEVRYGLLHESRRKRIGYENKEPISYTIFKKILITLPHAPTRGGESR